jgi:hypothetical protein
MPDHLVPLAKEWALWRWFCLRGTGFSIDRVLALGAPEVARAVDETVEPSAALEEAIRSAIAQGERALAASDNPRAFIKVIKRLRAGVIPDLPDLPELAGALDHIRRARAGLDDRMAQARLAYESECSRLSHAVRDTALDTRFREALLWQNRTAVYTAVDWLLRHDVEGKDAETSKARQKEHLVANYLQRYCVKNDTIGFFGPVGWGTFCDDPTLSIRPGPALLAKRTVFFEHWAIDALAKKLATNPLLRCHLAPRMLPTVWLDGDVLHHPIDRTTTLPAAFAGTLALCDGELSARAIAEQLIARADLELDNIEEVFDVLDQLVERGLATWTLDIPTVGAPDQHLAERLARIPDEEARAEGLAILAELQARRVDIARAAGDAQTLDAALDALDTSFTSLVGVNSVRRSGQMYAGRTLVYEECVRDLDLQVGRSIIERLAQPLELLLVAARWYTSRIAHQYANAFAGIYTRLVAETGHASVDFLRFWQHAASLFPDDGGTPIVDDVLREVHRVWAGILAIDPDSHDRLVERSADALAPLVGAAFAADGPGWPGARLHAPDLMIAAATERALADGQFIGVLGEMHVAENTYLAPAFMLQHPDPDSLLRAREADLPPSLALVTSAERATRVDYVSLLHRDFDLELGATRSWRPRDHVVPVGRLCVEHRDGQLLVCRRDSDWSLPIVAFFEYHLTAAVSRARFGILAPTKHSPRVMIGALAVSRETWRFATDELAFVHEKTMFDRFSGARAWARLHGLPRFVFYRVETEPKPCYLDLASAMYVEIFAKAARGATTVSVSEMLPGPDDMWLRDAANKRYVCELRIAARDPLVWRPTV